MSPCHLVILSGHSPQSSPTSGAKASSTGSTLVSSSSAAQSGQVAVMVCSFLRIENEKLRINLRISGCSLRQHGTLFLYVGRFSPRREKNDLHRVSNPGSA